MQLTHPNAGLPAILRERRTNTAFGQHNSNLLVTSDRDSYVNQGSAEPVV